MRPLILFILLFAWVSACAPASKKNRKQHRNTYPYDQQAKKQKHRTKQTKPKSTLQGSNPASSASINPSILPTILNEHDKTLMILINAGKYFSGKEKNISARGALDKKNSNPRYLSAFYIDRTEITVTQFRQYQPKYDEKPFTRRKDCPDCPAMGINWIHASKYCLSAGKRLPSEEEWEAAARGVTKFSYPWGETFQPSRANLFGEKDGHVFSAPVGSFQSGASASGVMDMAGNVWEWVDNKKSERPLPNLRVVKGGGWTSNKEQALISFRNHVDLKMKNPTFGFRCVKSLIR